MEEEKEKLTTMEPMLQTPGGETLDKSITTAVIMGCGLVIISLIQIYKYGFTNNLIFSFILISVLTYGVSQKNRTSSVGLLLVALLYIYQESQLSLSSTVFWLIPLYFILQGTIATFRLHKPFP